MSAPTQPRPPTWLTSLEKRVEDATGIPRKLWVALAVVLGAMAGAVLRVVIRDPEQSRLIWSAVQALRGPAKDAFEEAGAEPGAGPGEAETDANGAPVPEESGLRGPLNIPTGDLAELADMAFLDLAETDSNDGAIVSDDSPSVETLDKPEEPE